MKIDVRDINDEQVEIPTMSDLQRIETRLTAVETALETFSDKVQGFADMVQPYLEQISPMIDQLANSPLFRAMTGGKKK